MSFTGRMKSVIASMRTSGPGTTVGCVPLLALLPRRVTDDEIATMAATFSSRGRWPSSSTDVGVAVFNVTGELPAIDEIARVSQRLNAIRTSGPVA